MTSSSSTTSVKKKVDMDTATWWEENASAQYRGMIGSILVFVGMIMNLITTLNDLVNGTVSSSIPGLALVTAGSVALLTYAYTGLQPPFFFGCLHLTMGLLGYLSCIVWLEYVTASSDCNTGDGGSYSYGALYWPVVIFLGNVGLGLVTIAKRAGEHFKEPYGGPDNYLMLSVSIFIIGLLLSKIPATSGGWLTDPPVTFGLRLNTDAFVGYLFVIAAVFLLLHCCRANYNFNGILLQRFPATDLTSTSTLFSALALRGARMILHSLSLMMVVMIFTYGHQSIHFEKFNYIFNVNVVGTATGFIGFAGYAAIALAYRFNKNAAYHCPTLGWGYALLSIGMCCQGVTQLRVYLLESITASEEADVIISWGMVCTGVLCGAGALVVFRSGLKCYFPPLVNPGNYAFILAPFLTLGSAICCTLHGLQTLEGGSRGGVSPDMLAFIGIILHNIAALLLVLHAYMASDVSAITNYVAMEKKEESGGGGGGDGDVRSAPPSYADSGNCTTESAGVTAWETKAADGAKVEQIDVDVIIVGGGPVGLSLANELGIRGVKALLVEKRKEVIPDSRFTVVNPATMEGLKRLGLNDKLVEESTPPDFAYGASLSVGLTQPDARVVGRLDGPSRNEKTALGYHGMKWQYTRANASRFAEQQTQRAMQSAQEKILKEGAESRPSIEVRYGWELLDFRQGVREAGVGGSDDVTAIVAPVGESMDDEESNDPAYKDRAGVAIVRGKYIIGCDGQGSKVAEKVGIRYDGFINLSTSRSTLIHAPKLLSMVRDKYGEQLQYHMVVKNFGVGYIVPSDVRRCLWTFHLIGTVSGTEPKDVLASEIPGIVQKFIGPDVEFEVRKDARWYWNFVVAQTYRQGRAFICGDAAHSWPPFGAFGGNTGYQDACNLGWKLAASVKGWAGPNLLDSYEIERRSAALRSALHVLRLAPDPEALQMVTKLAPHPVLGKLVADKWHYANSGLHIVNHFSSDGMFLGLRYDHSPLCLRGKNDIIVPESPACEYWPVLAPGGRAPHLPLDDGSTLYERLAYDGYTVVVTRPQEEASIRASLSVLEAAFAQLGLPALKVLNIASTLAHEYVGAHAKIASLYKAHPFIIVRPDFYVLWIGDEVKDTTLGSVIAEAAAGKTSMSASESAQMTSASAWLTDRWLKEIQPFKFRFPHALFVRNKTKKEMLATVQRKK